MSVSATRGSAESAHPAWALRGLEKIISFDASKLGQWLLTASWTGTTTPVFLPRDETVEDFVREAYRAAPDAGEAAFCLVIEDALGKAIDSWQRIPNGLPCLRVLAIMVAEIRTASAVPRLMRRLEEINRRMKSKTSKPYGTSWLFSRAFLKILRLGISSSSYCFVLILNDLRRSHLFPQCCIFTRTAEDCSSV